ncbi:MAG TPA: alginate lyase family protein [Methylomirabilota bacterium]
MSPREVQHRLVVATRRQLSHLPWFAAAADRDDPWVAQVAADPALRAGLPAALARRLATRIYGDDWSAARLATSLTAVGAAERLVAEADDILVGRVRVLGFGPLDLGNPIDWHRDALTGGHWPRCRWPRTLSGEARGLDVKVVWEPNRHQHLQTLAAAAALTGRRAYADELARQLAGWIEQNPTGVGVHWVESTEPAFRVLAWLWSLPLVLDAPAFTPDLCLRVLRSLVAQTRHIAGHLSIYSSPNTHLLIEALTLFVVGTVLRELHAAAAWREQGRAILEREIETQVRDDGFYREASSYYHAYAVEFYLIATVVGERNGVALAPAVRTRLEQMLEALAWLVRPDGSLPNFGDADGGRTLRLGAPNLQRVDELLTSGAILTGRTELRAGLPSTGEEAAWLWPDGLARLAALGPAAAPRGGRQFADARLVVERRRVDGDERWALLDAGDMGMLSGGHGHAGCLGLGLYAHGRPLVVDRGTYVYNAAPAWRRYFRGTRAHSTVVIDGVEQATPARGNFQWDTRYRSQIVRHVAVPDYGVVTAEHDGFRRLPAPVGHRRTLLSVAGEYWLCIDAFTGSGTHTAEFRFQLAPDLQVDQAGTTLFAAPPDGAAGLLLVPVGFETPDTRVAVGEMEPLEGWHSDDYGQRRPAATLLITDGLRPPAVRVHVLAPCMRAPHARPVVQSQRLADGMALTVRAGETTDLLLCGPGARQALSAHGATFVGELLHARLDAAGGLRQFLAVQARSLIWNGETLIETETPVDYVIKDEEPLLERA